MPQADAARAFEVGTVGDGHIRGDRAIDHQATSTHRRQPGVGARFGEDQGSGPRLVQTKVVLVGSRPTEHSCKRGGGAVGDADIQIHRERRAVDDRATSLDRRDRLVEAIQLKHRAALDQQRTVVVQTLSTTQTEQATCEDDPSRACRHPTRVDRQRIDFAQERVRIPTGLHEQTGRIGDQRIGVRSDAARTGRQRHVDAVHVFQRTTRRDCSCPVRVQEQRYLAIVRVENRI